MLYVTDTGIEMVSSYASRDHLGHLTGFDPRPRSRGRLRPGQGRGKGRLARHGRHAGLPVLPGLVIDTGDSLGHMRPGARSFAAVVPEGHGWR